MWTLVELLLIALAIIILYDISKDREVDVKIAIKENYTKSTGDPEKDAFRFGRFLSLRADAIGWNELRKKGGKYLSMNESSNRKEMDIKVFFGESESVKNMLRRAEELGLEIVIRQMDTVDPDDDKYESTNHEIPEGNRQLVIRRDK